MQPELRGPRQSILAALPALAAVAGLARPKLALAAPVRVVPMEEACRTMEVVEQVAVAAVQGPAQVEEVSGRQVGWAKAI
jgi:hypothetical protein